MSVVRNQHVCRAHLNAVTDLVSLICLLSLRFSDAKSTKQHRRAGESLPLPSGAARIVQEGDVPLSDDDNDNDAAGGGETAAAAAAKQPVRHPDEELEAELEAAEQRQASQQQSQQRRHPDEEWEPDAAGDGDSSDEEEREQQRAAVAAAAAAAGRMSPPPVSAAELASGELEVVSVAEDRRMLELLRQQVGWECCVVRIMCI